MTKNFAPKERERKVVIEGWTEAKVLICGILLNG